tara:strand:- start:573 stop:1814 length:1242 start_codon:yes stop_codon:yes gene_type:complete
MTNKFDTNKRNFLICFGVSILVLLFNLEINKISFFNKLDIPKKIEIYFLLLINTYLYYEVLTSWLLIDLKSELSKKIYNINFAIVCLSYISIISIVIYKTFDVKILFDYTIFSILILITFSIIYFLFLFFIRLIISIYISKFDVIINFSYIVFNLLILFFIINKLLDVDNFNRTHLIIFIVALVITTTFFVYFLIKNKYIRNYLNKRVYMNQMFQNSSWLNEISKKDASERKEIIKHASKLQELSYILNDKEIPIEKKIVDLIALGKTNEVIEIFNQNKELDINHQRCNGWTYLHTSVSEGEYEITKYLLENGIEINIKNQIGLFPIYFAVSYGFIDLLKLLIEYHADVDAVDSRGETLIFHAIRNNNLEIVKLLVESGANLKIKLNRINPVKFSQLERKGKITKYLKSVTKK